MGVESKEYQRETVSGKTLKFLEMGSLLFRKRNKHNNVFLFCFFFTFWNGMSNEGATIY